MSEKSSSAEPVPTVVNGHTFTIDTRYILKDSRILGKGSFGVVCTANDSIRKIEIAIKRIRPYANDEWDAKHTLREIRLLKLLGPHPNIVSLYELSLFETKTELYMMMELMDCDLHRVIQSKQPLSEKHHKCFVKQILEAIKAMHAIGVFHRDLKPGNILVSKDCQVRITDFGLARFMDEPTRSGQNEVSPMTEYVVTRWYRPPELLLSPSRPYSEAIDLWSIGCILAELLRRKPLFPGKNHANQVQLIFEVLGYSPEDDMGFPVTGEAAAFLDKRCRFRKQPLKKFLPDASDEALHLVEILLTVNPDKRPSAVTSLNHPFLADAELLHDYSRPYLQRPTVDYFDFEHEKYTVSELKAMIEREVHTNAANAYRFAPANSSALSAAPSNLLTVRQSPISQFTPSSTQSGVVSSQQHLTSAHSQQSLSKPGSSATTEDSEGPASQLATQIKNNRIHQATKDNPFSKPAAGNNAATVANRGGRGIADDSSDAASNDARQQLSSLLQKNELDPRSGPSGSLLTAVRNDMGPPGTRGRKSVPKTPSPQKMDIILQKDYQNKLKFAQQQAGQDSTADSRQNSARSTGSAESYHSNSSYGKQQQSQPGYGQNAYYSSAGVAATSRSARSTFPNGADEAPIPGSHKRSNSGLAASNANTNNNNVMENNSNPTKRIGKIMGSMGMPFPKLSNPMKAFTASGTNNSSKKSSSLIPASALGGGDYTSQNYGTNTTMNRSSTMVHSGSNVIYQNGGAMDYDGYHR